MKNSFIQTKTIIGNGMKKLPINNEKYFLKKRYYTGNNI